MQSPNPNPVESLANLRVRVERLLRPRPADVASRMQLPLVGVTPIQTAEAVGVPTTSVAQFLDFLAASVPSGGVYLFGGVLRDLALVGARGFQSDIDVVVEGHWAHCVRYIEHIGARQNKFGGYRLQVGDWPVDVWNAEETWAIRRHLVAYNGIASLTETTVLNWDAILMNWVTGQFVHRRRYLEELRDRTMDIVLTENPNPLGMAVRVFRHLCVKDARRITHRAAAFLANAAAHFSFDEIRTSELRSYGNAYVVPRVYQLFENMNSSSDLDIGTRFGIATEILEHELHLV